MDIEDPELFSVVLSNATNEAVLGEHYIASVTIDDDVTIALIEDAAVTSSSGGSMTMWYLLLMTLLVSMRKIVKK